MQPRPIAITEVCPVTESRRLARARSTFWREYQECSIVTNPVTGHAAAAAVAACFAATYFYIYQSQIAYLGRWRARILDEEGHF